jgi:hypothetical protein
MLRQSRPTAGARHDDGLSSITVLFTFLALTALVMVTAVYAANAVRPAARQMHWTRAGAAAEAGLADYQQRLLVDPASWLDVDCGDPALVGQDPGVLPHACPWAPGEVGWAPVEDGLDPGSSPAYHYEVTTAPDELDDIWARALTLTVTGRSGDVQRVLEVRLARASTADHALHQVSELVEPRTWSEGALALGAPAALDEECSGTTALAADRSVLCPNTGVLVAGDVITGSAWTRDALLLASTVSPGADPAVVDGEYATADPACAPDVGDPATWLPCVGAAGGTVTATQVEQLLGGWAPVHREWTDLPTSTATLYDGVPGCHYFGATRIVGEGAQMRVWSPGTDAARTRGATLAVAGPDGVLPTCGTGTVPVPDGVAITVWTTPQEYLAPAGGWATDAPLDTGTGQIGGDATYGWLPVGAYGPTPDPAQVLDGSWLQGVVDPETTRTQKWARYGNLYLEGYFSPGAALGTGDTRGVTFVAQESVVVTGDVLRTGASATDPCADVGTECLIGVVAGRDVEVLHPWVTALAGTGTDADDAWWDFDVPVGGAVLRAPTAAESRHGSGFAGWPHRYVDRSRGAVFPDTAGRTGVQIQAAVQALSGTLRVQHYWQSTDGVEVVVQGSLAQRYAGAYGAMAVDAGVAGASAHYPTLVHDPALALASPPYLAPLVGQAWQARAITELAG